VKSSLKQPDKGEWRSESERREAEMQQVLLSRENRANGELGEHHAGWWPHAFARGSSMHSYTYK